MENGDWGRITGTDGYRFRSGHVVVELLRAIGGIPQKLSTALGGRSLAVELVVEGPGGGRFLVLLSPDGVVYRMREGAVVSGGFRPHVTFRGTPAELVAVALGERDTPDAVFAGTLVLHVETDELLPRYPRVMRIVAEELARLLRR